MSKQQYRLTVTVPSPIQTPLGETDELTVTDCDPLGIDPEHTAASIWTVETVADEDTAISMEQFAQHKAEARIWIQDERSDVDGEELAERGRLHNTDYEESSGRLTVEGENAVADLRAQQREAHYDNIVVDDAITDYWSRIPGWTATVYDPADPEITIEDEVVQSASTADDWSDLVDFPDTSPLYADDDGLSAHQTNWVWEYENWDDSNITLGTATNDDASGGEEQGHTLTVGDYAEFRFIPGYDIPAGDLVVGYRIKQLDTGSDGAPDLGVYLDGEELTDSIGGYQSTYLHVQEPAGGILSIPSEDISAGETHTLRMEITAAPSDPDILYFDVISIGDGRYPYNYDNTNDGNGGYLDGPGTHPDAQTVLLQSEIVSANVTDALVSGTWDDTRYDQQIRVSNDGFDSNIQTVTNSDTADVSFTGEGRELQVEFTLDRYPQGEDPQNATPRYGYDFQTIDDYELQYTGDELAVIVDERFDSNDLDNLQELHSRGDYRFTVIPTDGDPIEAESYQRGEEVRQADWQAISRNRSVTTESYYNRVYVKGPKDEETGERPVTMRQDDAEIQRLGGDPNGDDSDVGIHAKTLIRNDLETESSRATVARQEVRQAVAAAETAGTIEVVPTLLLPGYRYDIPAWGVEADLETVSFSIEHSGGNASLNFDRRLDIVGRIESTRQDVGHEQRRR